MEVRTVRVMLRRLSGILDCYRYESLTIPKSDDLRSSSIRFCFCVCFGIHRCGFGQPQGFGLRFDKFCKEEGNAKIVLVRIRFDIVDLGSNLFTIRLTARSRKTERKYLSCVCVCF